MKRKTNFLDRLGLSKAKQATWFLRAFGVTKIPLLAFIGPSVRELSDSTCVVRIPLNWRTRNHLGSMYFGVLAAGADCAGGLAAMRKIQESGVGVSLVFKDFSAKFLKRAEGDVDFVCTQGLEIADLVQRTVQSESREELAVHVVGRVGAEDVALFTLTLSLKRSKT